MTIATAISTMEGWLVPNSLAQRNNNPGNLRYVGQTGAIGQDANGFAIFATPADGQAALQAQIDLDASRGLTVSQFINKYAPPSENNTSNYLSYVTQQTGLNANDPLSLDSGGIVDTSGGATFHQD